MKPGFGLVIAYLMADHKMSLRDAHKMVAERRTIARPNPGFIEQLGKLELQLTPGLEQPTLTVDDVFHGETLIDLEKFDAPVPQATQ
jgi:hypothetical protein